jgi:hypothetical protein
MKQLYEEALADVKKLKEVAEDNAKKALIEAVAPRIKDLIENELMKSQKDDLLLDDEFEDVPVSMSGMASDLAGDRPDIGSAISLPDESGKVTLDLDALSVEPSGDSNEYKMSVESKKTLGNLVEKINSAAIVKVESRLYKLTETVDKINKTSSLMRKLPGFQKFLSDVSNEIGSLYEGIQTSSLNSAEKEVYQEKLEKLYKDVNKLTEQRNMRNRNKINEGDVTLKLTGMPDDINLDDVGVDLISGEGEEEAEGEEGGEELDLGEEGEEGAEGEEEAEEGTEEEAEAEEGAEEEAGEEEDIFGGEEKKGSDQATQKEARMLRNPNLVVEIDENMLRREITKMKNLRESRESNDVIVEIDENMLRREIKRMRTLRESKEGMLGKDPHKWGHGPGKVSDEFEDDDLGDPFLDVSLREGDMPSEGIDELDELDEMYSEEDEKKDRGVDEMYEMEVEAEEPSKGVDELDELDEMYSEEDEKKDHSVDELDELDETGVDQAEDPRSSGGNVAPDSMGKGAKTNKESRKPGTTLESLRRRIAQERRLQTEAKKKAQQAKAQQKESLKKAQKAQHEAQQAKKQKQSGKAQKKTQEARHAQGKAKQLGEAYAFFATKFNESVLRTRRLTGMLNEVASRRGSQNGTSRLSEGAQNLQRKLAETNLFNTKLLYSNKLLQNESLTRRQKAEVIERLDEARSEREVKLVYETMVKSFEGTGRQLSEAADRRVLGSSSQATRPASTLMNEGVELDRWARLAGIK